MSGETILVVDDSQQMVDHLAKHILPTFGYKTLHAYNGEAGLAAIRDQNPDLVLLDFNLPKMTGIDVLQQMAQESMNTPVVLMTGFGSELSAQQAFRLGAKDYLIKPFTIDEIVETVDRALVERRLQHDKEKLAEQLRRLKVEISSQKHEMNTLFNIGKAITSLLSVDQILERVLEASTYLTKAEESSMWIPDVSGEWLTPYEYKAHSDASMQQSEPMPIENTPIGQVIYSGNPTRQSQFSEEGVEIYSSSFARAILYVPLKLRGVTMGVLGVHNREKLASFSQHDEFLLSFLADYAAIALENARVFQAADRALAAGLDELNTLIEITQTITSTLTLDEVITNTIHQIHKSWQIEAASIWLLDADTQTLSILDNVGTPETDDVRATLQVPLGKGFLGQVAQTGKRIYTNDVDSHPLHYKKLDSATGFQTRSLLCVPITWQDKIIGALQLLNKKNGSFDDRDVERAIAIATALAIAIQNALLYEESEARKTHLESTLEHNNNPILITDVQNRIHLLNQQARQRLELDETAVGQPITNLLKPTKLADMMQASLVDLNPITPIQFSDGSVWLPKIADIPAHGRILILQDITHLQELDKAKNLFVANISQDMLAPLNRLDTLAHQLAQTTTLTDEQSEFLHNILQQSDQMMALVYGLRELSTISMQNEERKTYCNILDIVTDVVEEYQQIGKQRGITLNYQTHLPIGVVKGDATQLRAAVSNLLDNAFKYSPEGESVDIGVQQDANEQIHIQIKDRGIGIPEEELPHIFDVFYRGDKEQIQNGVGLGLSIVHSIIKVHNGNILVESQPQQGTQFTISLPLAYE